MSSMLAIWRSGSATHAGTVGAPSPGKMYSVAGKARSAAPDFPRAYRLLSRDYDEGLWGRFGAGVRLWFRGSTCISLTHIGPRGCLESQVMLLRALDGQTPPHSLRAHPRMFVFLECCNCNLATEPQSAALLASVISAFWNVLLSLGCRPVSLGCMTCNLTEI